MSGGIAKRWKELSGQDKWEQLLYPLDNDLRRYLIHYGEMAQATYDTFNFERASKYAGDSKYSKKNLFSRVGLDKANPFKYTVTRYIYATSQIPVPLAFILKSLSREAWNKESNWIGYIAVATDEGKALLGRRDILIAWRGTIQASEWASDFDYPLVPASKIFKGHDHVKCHSGFLSMYTSSDERSQFCKISARDQILDEMQRLLEVYKNEEISLTITGHSMGASLATINAADIAVNGFNKHKGRPDEHCLVTAFCFAAPYSGESKYQEMCHSTKDLHILRICNAPDVIPTFPLAAYSAVGEELRINTQKSKYLKFPGDVVSWHCLEGYLHGIAGTQGEKGGFHLEVKRDIALVNKHLDILREEYLVPGAWWSLENKGMVQGADGIWKLDDHEED